VTRLFQGHSFFKEFKLTNAVELQIIDKKSGGDNKVSDSVKLMLDPSPSAQGDTRFSLSLTNQPLPNIFMKELDECHA
jgi:hypothetical protein